MPSLKIDDGIVRLDIERNGEIAGQIAFNPKDELFVEKFYQLVASFNKQFASFEERAKELDADNEMETFIHSDVQIPVNMPQRLALIRELCEYIYGKIDEVFGAGTSKTLFGDAMVLEAIPQFFDGITPYIQKSRTEQVNKYLPKKSRKRK